VSSVVGVDAACHAGGPGSESRRSRLKNYLQPGTSVAGSGGGLRSWPNPVARRQKANSLQIALFTNELVARSHEQKQVTGEGRHYSCRVSSGCSVVLVDEAAEAVAATDRTDGHRRSWLLRPRRLQLERTMRPLRVVVVDVGAQHTLEVRRWGKQSAPHVESQCP
jgi:hypothetical protein